MSNPINPIAESSIAMDDIRALDRDLSRVATATGLEPDDEDPAGALDLALDEEELDLEQPDDEITGLNIGLRLRRAYRDARSVNFEQENVESMDLEEPDLFIRRVECGEG